MIALTLSAAPLAAQDTVATLPAVEVRVTRDRARSPLELPYAITSSRPDSLRPGHRRAGLEETLLLLPGVRAVTRSNPTQDPRLSIRGFGARAAFGVRGIHVVRDGIPLTLPDGQTPVDFIDLESVGRVEVIRGSASALYGNAAGGIIELRSAEPPPEPLVGDARVTGGSFGLRRWVAGAGGTSGALRYQGNISRDEVDGYRDHGRQRTTTGFGRVQFDAGGTKLALSATLYEMPLGENPGALTLDQFRQDPRSADPASVRKGAGKRVRHHQLGLVANRPVGDGEVSAVLFGGRRWLDNPLPFAVIDVGRTTAGASLRGSVPFRLGGRPIRLQAGVDFQRQDDDRRNFENCIEDGIPTPTPTPPDCPSPGSERGKIVLDQRELVTGLGAFLHAEIELAERYRVSAGGRVDRVTFEVRDRLVAPSDADDSGERSLPAVSPMLGFVARVSPLTSIYANFSTAFETPTATELANQPDGSAGINRDLEPQYATTVETGVRGVLLSRVEYDVATYLTKVRDELIPFEVTGGGGRRHFRNAGRTTRIGAELGLRAPVGPVGVAASYSYAHYEFDEFAIDGVDYAGNRIPGIPVQQLQASATWRHRSFFATVEGIVAGRVYVSDANDTRAGGYEVLNVRLGGSAFLGASRLSPVLGVQNLFDRRYAPSISVNAAGGKYYEPAPGRAIYAGLSLGVGGGEPE